jgi:hypothetical protein
VGFAAGASCAIALPICSKLAAKNKAIAETVGFRMRPFSH